MGSWRRSNKVVWTCKPRPKAGRLWKQRHDEAGWKARPAVETAEKAGTDQSPCAPWNRAGHAGPKADGRQGPGSGLRMRFPLIPRKPGARAARLRRPLDTPTSGVLLGDRHSHPTRGQCARNVLFGAVLKGC